MNKKIVIPVVIIAAYIYMNQKPPIRKTPVMSIELEDEDIDALETEVSGRYWINNL